MATDLHGQFRTVSRRGCPLSKFHPGGGSFESPFWLQPVFARSRYVPNSQPATWSLAAAGSNAGPRGIRPTTLAGTSVCCLARL